MRGMEPADLTPKQALFVAEYIKDLNATQAAIRAGYSRDSASEQGYQLLQKTSVQSAIANAAAARKQRVQVDGDLVLRELLALATVDLAAAYDEQGNLKPIHDIPPEVRKAIAGVEVFEEFEGVGKDRHYVGQTKKLKLWDRPRSLEMLGRHLALFNDKTSVQLTGANGGPVKIDDPAALAKLEALIAVLERREQEDGSDLV